MLPLLYSYSILTMSFGQYNSSNPPTQGSTVTIGGGTYVFDYVGNHWKLEK